MHREGQGASAPSVARTLPVQSADKHLDPGACLALLGDLYPTSAAMLYFELEAFLQRGETLRSQYLEGLGSATHDSSWYRRASASGTTAGRRSLLSDDVDVVGSYDAKSSLMQFKLRAKASCVSSSSTTSLPAELAGPLGVRVRASVAGQDGLTRVLEVPLAALMSDWGEVAAGYFGYTHAISIRRGKSEVPERWVYVGVGDGATLLGRGGSWLQRMDRQEREIRTGCNRQFHAAWHQHVGDAEVVLESTLVCLRQTESDILDWEEAAVEHYVAARKSLNLVPGGRPGMRYLAGLAVLPGEYVTIEERDDAIERWAQASNPMPGVTSLPHLLAASTFLRGR